MVNLAWLIMVNHGTLVKIMANHDTWNACQDHGKIMARSWQDHGKIMARSWQDHGKIMARSWQDHGKIMARSWQDLGKASNKRYICNAKLVISKLLKTLLNFQS